MKSYLEHLHLDQTEAEVHWWVGGQTLDVQPFPAAVKVARRNLRTQHETTILAVSEGFPPL